MTPSPAGPGRHLLLYDGPCGFCNAVVGWVLAHDRRGLFDFAPLQSGVAARVLGDRGASADPDTVRVVPDYRSGGRAVLERGQAAVFVATSLGGPWRAAALLGALPAAWLDAAYDRVARRRHRLFAAACVLPRPEQRTRFLGLGEDAGSEGGR